MVSTHHHDDFGRDALVAAITIIHIDRVLVHERAQRVVVFHLFAVKLRNVAPVHRLDVILDIGAESFPLQSQLACRPAVIFRVVHRFSVQRRSVHQLFRDAAHVHAGTTESPCGALHANISSQRHGMDLQDFASHEVKLVVAICTRSTTTGQERLFGNQRGINICKILSAVHDLGRWLDEVEDGDFGALDFSRGFGACQAARSSADHNEVVIVFGA